MDCPIESANNKTATPLKSRRVLKPNSFIFTSDNVVRMPQKKHLQKNLLLNNAIKTINKKANLNKSNQISRVKEKLNNECKLKNRLNGRIGRNSKISIDKNKIAKRKTIKRKPKFETDQLTNSSSEDTESNSIPNENKNLINLKSESINHTLHHLFTKQPITKNGKIRGRPRKPIKIDNLLGIMNGGLVVNGKNDTNDSTQNVNFKNLLEKIHESHQNQINKLRLEIEEKDKDKLVVEIRNASLVKENEMLRKRIMNLINESSMKKELDVIRSTHEQEISEIKKKLWCSNDDCEERATYFCCFNAFYCSLECQSQHWYSNHKKKCRNKNRIKNSHTSDCLSPRKCHL